MPSVNDVVARWNVFYFVGSVLSRDGVVWVLNTITPALHEFVHTANHLKYFVIFLKRYFSVGYFLSGNRNVHNNFSALLLVYLTVMHDGVYVINGEISALTNNANIRSEFTEFGFYIYGFFFKRFSSFDMLKGDHDVFHSPLVVDNKVMENPVEFIVGIDFGTHIKVREENEMKNTWLRYFMCQNSISLDSTSISYLDFLISLDVYLISILSYSSQILGLFLRSLRGIVGEVENDAGRFFSHTNFLYLCSKRFMPCGKFIFSRRNIFNLKLSFVSRNGKKWIIGNDNPSGHPFVKVAFDLDRFWLF